MSTPRYRTEATNPCICTVSIAAQRTGASPKVEKNQYTTGPFRPHQKKMWDYVTPNYFRLKAQNAILPVNELLIEKTAVKFSAGETRYTDSRYAPRTVYHHTHSGDGLVLAGPWRNKIPTVSQMFPSNGGPSIAEQQQLAIAAVANARQDLLDGMTFLAELEKTVDMFKSCVNRYTQRLLVVEKNARVAYRTLKRGSFGTVSSLSFADCFASTWMEYRYGWTPLSYDVTALYKQLLELEALFHRVRKSSDAPVETVSETLSRVSGTGYTFGTTTLGGYYPWSCESTTGSEYSVRATALLELTNSFRVTCDPLLTAVELIPYSWMADWFLNIGDLLRTFSPFALGELKSCSVTSKRTNYVRARLVPPALTTGFTLDSHTAAKGAVEFSQTHRVPITPEITFDLKAELSVYRLLDALSLVIGKSSRMMRALARTRDWSR